MSDPGLVGELVAALRQARDYIQADLDCLLASYCVLDGAGAPILETLDEDDCSGVPEANAAIERIDAAIAHAEGGAP